MKNGRERKKNILKNKINAKYSFIPNTRSVWNSKARGNFSNYKVSVSV